MKTKFLIPTLIALIVISIVAVYGMPFGLRGVVGEGYQNPATSVQAIKAARSSLAKKEGFQTLPVQPVTIPPANPVAIPITKVTPPTAPKTVPVGMPAVPSMMPTTPSSAPPATVPKVPATPPAAPPANQAQLAIQHMDASGNIMQGFQNMNVAENQGNMYRKDMREGFRSNYAEVSNGAKDSYQPIGAFDGVALSTGNKSSWRYTAPDEALLGAPFKVGDDSLFMFKNNQCKPECCGASFSCSGGCVCTTPDQRNYINGRGGNRTAPADD